MPRIRPTLPQILERIYADFEAGGSGIDPRNRGSAQNAISRAIAGASHAAHGAIEYDTKQALPITATDPVWIEWHASVWLVAGRKAAAFAAGSITFTGLDGAIVLAATLLQRADGTQFTTDAEATITFGSALVPVTAVVAGADGNTAAASTLSLVSPISGINAAAIVDSAAISNGTDSESDARLLERVLDRIKTPPHGGNTNDYVTWAKEVAAVTRAWVYPREMGIGTITVRFVVDDDPVSLIPDAAKVAEVLAHIDALCPVPLGDGFGLYVAAPVAAPLAITIAGLTPATQVVKDAIAAEIADLLSREAIPGGTVLISHIREAISIAAGETDHQLIAPAADVIHGAGQIATPGVITYG